MAYNFVSSNNQYLSAPLTVAGPLTLSIWVRPTSSASTSTLLTRNASNDDRYAIALASISGSLNPRCSEVKDGVSSNLVTNTGFVVSLNQWIHIAGVFSSTSSRTIYANGGNALSDSTSFYDLGTSEIIQLGAARGTSGNPAPKTVTPNTNGDLAEPAIWSVALTAQEIASLGKGVSPRLIRPQSLVFYAPLIRDLIDTKGGLIITNNNAATVSDHPRIYS